MAEWIEIAQMKHLTTGKMMRVQTQGKNILLANAEGRLYAVDDACTHEEASLSIGCLQSCYVKCPLHGSRFDLRTGKAMEEPATEALQVYPLKIENGLVFIEI